MSMSFPGRERCEGLRGHVTVPIPGGEKPGEVTLRIRGGTEAYIAYADEQVSAGTEVVVIEDRGARTLFVAPL
jgi:membrane protein implicated in regulation of membrane protease activity